MRMSTQNDRLVAAGAPKLPDDMHYTLTIDSMHSSHCAVVDVWKDGGSGMAGLVGSVTRQRQHLDVETLVDMAKIAANTAVPGIGLGDGVMYLLDGDQG